MRVLRITLLIFLVVIGAACRKESNASNLKPVLEQKAGEYTVSVLSETGSIQKDSGSFVLEFRKTGSSQLEDVGKVEVSPVMEMAGMAPMMGGAEVTSSSTPGRYNVKGNFSMTGLWKVSVRFGSDKSVRFNLNAE